MLLRLGGGEPLIGIVHQKFLNQIAALLADVRQLSLDLLAFMIREIKVNMGRVPISNEILKITSSILPTNYRAGFPLY